MSDPSLIEKIGNVIEVYFIKYIEHTNTPMSECEQLIAMGLVQKVCAELNRSLPSDQQQVFDPTNLAAMANFLDSYLKASVSLSYPEEMPIIRTIQLAEVVHNWQLIGELKSASGEVTKTIIELLLLPGAPLLSQTVQDYQDPTATQGVFQRFYPDYRQDPAFVWQRSLATSPDAIQQYITNRKTQDFFGPLEAARKVILITNTGQFDWTDFGSTPNTARKVAREFAVGLVEHSLQAGGGDREKLWPVVQCMSELCKRDPMTAPGLRRLLPQLRSQFGL